MRWIKFLSGPRATLLIRYVDEGRRSKTEKDTSFLMAMQPEPRIAAPELTKLFDESEISARVEELARAAAPRLPGSFVVVGLLVGSFVFVADLIRAFYRIGCKPSVDFMRLGSYGNAR